MKKIIFELLGWYGVAAVIVAYFLVSFSMIASTDTIYQLLNLTGAIGVGTISVYKRVWQTVTTNTIWVLIALLALARLMF